MRGTSSGDTSSEEVITDPLPPTPTPLDLTPPVPPSPSPPLLPLDSLDDLVAASAPARTPSPVVRQRAISPKLVKPKPVRAGAVDAASVAVGGFSYPTICKVLDGVSIVGDSPGTFLEGVLAASRPSSPNNRTKFVRSVSPVGRQVKVTQVDEEMITQVAKELYESMVKKAAEKYDGYYKPRNISVVNRDNFVNYDYLRNSIRDYLNNQGDAKLLFSEIENRIRSVEVCKDENKVYFYFKDDKRRLTFKKQSGWGVNKPFLHANTNEPFEVFLKTIDDITKAIKKERSVQEGERGI